MARRRPPGDADHEDRWPEGGRQEAKRRRPGDADHEDKWPEGGRQVTQTTLLSRTARKLVTMVVQRLIIDMFGGRQTYREKLEEDIAVRVPIPLHIPDPTHENASFQEADLETTNGPIENISPDLWDSLSRRYGSYSYAKPAGPWWKFVISPIPKHSIVRPAWKCHDPKWLIPLHWYWSIG